MISSNFNIFSASANKPKKNINKVNPKKNIAKENFSKIRVLYSEEENKELVNELINFVRIEKKFEFN